MDVECSPCLLYGSVESPGHDECEENDPDTAHGGGHDGAIRHSSQALIPAAPLYTLPRTLTPRRAKAHRTTTVCLEFLYRCSNTSPYLKCNCELFPNMHEPIVSLLGNRGLLWTASLTPTSQATTLFNSSPIHPLSLQKAAERKSLQHPFPSFTGGQTNLKKVRWLFWYKSSWRHPRLNTMSCSDLSIKCCEPS